MKIRVDLMTADAILFEVRDELLFLIRMDTISGTYETTNIKKVIYGDELKSSILFPASSAALQEENERGNKTTMIIAILFSTFAVGLLGFFMYVLRRQKVHERDTSSMESTEKTWRMALDRHALWKKSNKSFDSSDRNSNNDADYFDDQAEYFDDMYDDGIDDGPEATEVEPPNVIATEHELERRGRSYDYEIGDESDSDVDDEAAIEDPSEGRGRSFNIDTGDESSTDVDEVEGNDPLEGRGRSTDIDTGEEIGTDMEDDVEDDDPPHTDSSYQAINGAILALHHQSDGQHRIDDEGDTEDEVEGIESPGTIPPPNPSDGRDFT
jgi:hypothetical protein